MNRSRENAQVLFEKAAEDRYAVDRLIDDPSAPDSVVGFHAQQAVEKLMKAALATRSIVFPFTHDLGFLLDMLADHRVPPPPDADRIRLLTPYAMGIRYGQTRPEAKTQKLDRLWLKSFTVSVFKWAASII